MSNIRTGRGSARLLGRNPGAMAHDATIFLVDDDTAVRDSLRLLLETHGLAVRDFASGEQLLQETAPRPADCLICDLQTPVMSGHDVVEPLAKRGVASPAI